MLWERRWLIVGFVLVASALALATRPPTPVPLYRATATLEIRTITFSASGQSSVSSISGVPPQEVQAARSADVAAETARERGYKDGGLGILSRLEIRALESTDLLQLSLTGNGPRTVGDLDAYAKNYVDFRKQRDQEQVQSALKAVDDRIAALEPRLQTLSTRLASERRGGGQASDLTTAQFNALSGQYAQLVNLRERVAIDAQFAGGTVKYQGSPIVQRLGALPTRAIRTLAGPIVGLLLGAAIAIALGILRPRVAGRERAEDRFGYAVLAAIPHVPAAHRDPLQIQRVSAWGAEGIRMVLTELGLLEKRGKRVRSVVVASPEPREGRTTIARNLAASYAASGRSVALFHADGAGLPAAGSRGAQVGPHDITDVRMNRDGFAEVFTGPARAESSGIGVQHKGVTEIVGDLARDFDLVIVDTRPVLLSADAVALASQADAVLMVLRHLKTMEGKAGSAIEILERHDARIIGLVVNDHRLGAAERYRSSRAKRPDAITPAPPERSRRPVAAASRPSGPVEAELSRRRQQPPAGASATPIREHESIALPEVPASAGTGSPESQL